MSKNSITEIFCEKVGICYSNGQAIRIAAIFTIASLTIAAFTTMGSSISNDAPQDTRLNSDNTSVATYNDGTGQFNYVLTKQSDGNYQFFSAPNDAMDRYFVAGGSTAQRKMEEMLRLYNGTDTMVDKMDKAMGRRACFKFFPDYITMPSDQVKITRTIADSNQIPNSCSDQGGDVKAKINFWKTASKEILQGKYAGRHNMEGLTPYGIDRINSTIVSTFIRSLASMISLLALHLLRKSQKEAARRTQEGNGNSCRIVENLPGDGYEKYDMNSSVDGASPTQQQQNPYPTIDEYARGF